MNEVQDSLQIDSGIPIPKTFQQKINEAWLKMKDGDSFFIQPNQDASEDYIFHILRGLSEETRFLCEKRREGGGFRIWKSRPFNSIENDNIDNLNNRLELDRKAGEELIGKLKNRSWLRKQWDDNSEYLLPIAVLLALIVAAITAAALSR